MKETALCGLGQTAPNPVLSTLHYFRDEYIEHIEGKHCSAGVCKALIQYTINADQCIGCSACAKACPAGAIDGKLKQPHKIDPILCIQCGICMETCKFDAVAGF